MSVCPEQEDAQMLLPWDNSVMIDHAEEHIRALRCASITPCDQLWQGLGQTVKQGDVLEEGAQERKGLF